jgi:hypothetical protein
MLSLAPMTGATAASAESALTAGAGPRSNGPALAVSPQYDTTHVYVAPADFDRLVASLIETFGGAATKSRAYSRSRPRPVSPCPSWS